MDIAALRAEIDRVDAQLLALLDKRFGLAFEVAKTKHAEGKPARDPAREAAMLAAARQMQHENLKPDDSAALLERILEQSRRWVDLKTRAQPVKPARITIIGLGLIGGSLAMALKRAQPGHTLTGIDLPKRLEAPRASGLFDTLASPDEAAAAVRGSDFAFICTPLSRTIELLPELADDLPKGCTVTDVAGLKSPVVAVADTAFAAPDAAYFVGGHPMAGKAQQGFENAEASLFEGRPWILTPRREDPVARLNVLRALIESTGANLQLLTPAEHDRTVAFTSHLPQLVSTALMLVVSGRDRGVAGPALFDMTRLASSPVALWNELTSRLSPELISELQRLRAYLTELEIAVTFKEPMDKWFNRAAELRQELERNKPDAP